MYLLPVWTSSPVNRSSMISVHNMFMPVRAPSISMTRKYSVPYHTWQAAIWCSVVDTYVFAMFCIFDACLSYDVISQSSDKVTVSTQCKRAVMTIKESVLSQSQQLLKCASSLASLSVVKWRYACPTFNGPYSTTSTWRALMFLNAPQDSSRYDRYLTDYGL